MMKSQPKRTPRAVQRAIHRSNQTLKNLILQTPAEVEETQSLLGKTPSVRPERLQDADQVLKQIIAEDADKTEPTALGKTVTLLRTQKKLTIEDLAKRTDLDIEDLVDIETNPDLDADPMTIVVLAEFFHVSVSKMQRLAGLTHQCDIGEEFGSLHLAAGARPEFDQHSREEKKDLLRWIKQFRK